MQHCQMWVPRRKKWIREQLELGWRHGSLCLMLRFHLVWSRAWEAAEVRKAQLWNRAVATGPLTSQWLKHQKVCTRAGKAAFLITLGLEVKALNSTPGLKHCFFFFCCLFFFFLHPAFCSWGRQECGHFWAASTTERNSVGTWYLTGSAELLWAERQLP